MGNGMNYPEGRSALLSGALNEALWDTLITLGVAAAISISLIGLSAHLGHAAALSPSAGHPTAQVVSHAK